MSTCFNNLSQLLPPPPACERVTSLSASQTKWPPWPKTRTLNFFLYWALISLVIKKILKRGNFREVKMLTTISYQLQPEKTLHSENKIITMSWPSPNLNGLELNNKKTIISKKKSPTCYYCLWDLELTALPSPHLWEYCHPQPLFR